MPTVLDVLMVIKIWPKTNTGTEKLVLVSNFPYISSPADDPPSLPAVTTFRPFEVDEKGWQQEEDGLVQIGGVTELQALNVVLDNPRLDIGGTFSHPLDDVEDLDWNGARAEILSAQVAVDAATGRPSTQLPLSDLTRRETLVVSRFAPGEGDATVTLVPTDQLDAPSTPFAFRGWGHGAGARNVKKIARADQPATRGTGSFTVRWILSVETAANLFQPIHDGQVWLLETKQSESGLMVIALIRPRIRNAAGTWQSFEVAGGFDGRYVASFNKWYSIHMTYESQSKVAKIYRDGQLDAQIVVTGGLWAGSTAQNLLWLGSLWRCAGWAFYDVTKNDEWIRLDNERGIVKDPDMIAGLTFDEGLGSIAYDITGTADATVQDTDAWQWTGEGDASLAGSRPPALVGMPFGVPLELWSSFDSLYIPGYAGERDRMRHLTEDGHRLKPATTETAAVNRTVSAARDAITPAPQGSPYIAQQFEYASGQALTRSPASGSSNPTDVTVDRVLIDPVLGAAEVDGAFTTVEDQGTNETAAFQLSTADSQYTDQSFTLSRNGAPTHRLPVVGLEIATQGELSISIGRDLQDDSRSAIVHLLEQFGPEETPTTAYLKAGSEIWHHGWRGEGADPVRVLVDKVSRSSLSVDDAPLFVTRNPDGSLAVVGARLAETAEDFALQASQIEDITEQPLDAKPTAIEVRYAKCWNVIPPAEGLLVADDLVRAMRREWRLAHVGSGMRRGVFESSLLRPSDAMDQASALLRINLGRIFRVKLYAPVPDATIKAARIGTRTTVQFPKMSYFDAGRQGLVVGRQAGTDSLTRWLRVMPPGNPGNPGPVLP